MGTLQYFHTQGWIEFKKLRKVNKNVVEGSSVVKKNLLLWPLRCIVDVLFSSQIWWLLRCWSIDAVLSISQFCYAALFSFIKEKALFTDKGAAKQAWTNSSLLLQIQTCGGFHSSGMVGSVAWYLVTGVSRQPIGPIFKQSKKKLVFLDCLTLEDGTNRLCWKVI